MPNRSAFTHKPKRLDGVFFTPVDTKALWDKVWTAAKAQDWWEQDVACVGNQDGFFYFQIRGLTTGFARVQIELDPSILHRTDVERLIADKWVKRLGLGFHPDTRGKDYSPKFSKEDVAAYDRDMEQLFEISPDPYQAGIDAWTRAGLMRKAGKGAR